MPIDENAQSKGCPSPPKNPPHPNCEKKGEGGLGGEGEQVHAQLSPTNLCSDCLADSLAPPLQRRLVAALDDQARFWLGARIAQEHAATLRFQLCFGLGDQWHHAVQLV